MKITHLHIVNFRSINDVAIDFGASKSSSNTHYLIGENNAGKSNICAAIRKFYDVRGKDFSSDLPFDIGENSTSYIDLTFWMGEAECTSLCSKYKIIPPPDKGNFTIRRYLTKSKDGQNPGEYYILNENRKQNEHLVANKNIPDNVIEQIIGIVSYIPALTSPSDQVKTSGESPLRSLLYGVLKDKSFSESLNKIRDGLDGFRRALECSCEKTGGFLKEVNMRLARDWGMGMRLDLQKLDTEKILKTQMQVVFREVNLGTSHPLEMYGSGFQRSVANALIDVWASQKKAKGDVDVDTSFRLLIYEEPEAFLHPAQQNILADTLSKLGGQDNCQVLLTTHSPHFVVHAMNNLKNMVYVRKRKDKTEVQQYRGLFDAKLIELDNEFIESIPEKRQSDGNARLMIGPRMGKPKGMGIVDHNVIRKEMKPYFIQDWFSLGDASIFFARKVLLVEGLTEKNLLSYLMSSDYIEGKEVASSLGKRLLFERVEVVPTDGKFNMPRYVAILKEFGIPFAVLIDNDLEKYEGVKKRVVQADFSDGDDEWRKRKHAHQVYNKWLTTTAKGKIVKLDPELEACLGISKGKHKSLNVLKKLIDKRIGVDKLDALLTDVFKQLRDNACSI